METKHAALVEALVELETWVNDNEFDVSHSAFCRATMRCLRLAFIGTRIPVVQPGVIALDVACAVAGRYLATGIAQSRLPGAKEWREIQR